MMICAQSLKLVDYDLFIPGVVLDKARFAMKIRISYLRKLIREEVEQVFPVGKPGCPECGGKGYVDGMFKRYPCETCAKPEEEEPEQLQGAAILKDYTGPVIIDVSHAFMGTRLVYVPKWDPSRETTDQDGAIRMPIPVDVRIDAKYDYRELEKYATQLARSRGAKFINNYDAHVHDSNLEYEL